MSYVLYTATGCVRCKIVKDYMKKQDVEYVEKDMKADGKEDFQKFYAANRKDIYRGETGVEFPVFTDGNFIKQGLGDVFSYLHSGDRLKGYTSIGALHKEWLDGLHISGGDMAYAEEFLKILRHFKQNNLLLQFDTNGKNVKLLVSILEEKLADKIIMEVKGPLHLYGIIMGEEADTEEIKESIALVSKFSNYRFETLISPIVRDKKTMEAFYMTPGEIAETAKLILDVTSSRRQPWFLKHSNQTAIGELSAKAESLDDGAMFKYLNAAKEFQVAAGIVR